MGSELSNKYYVFISVEEVFLPAEEWYYLKESSAVCT